MKNPVKGAFSAMPANMPVSNTLGLLIYAEFTGTDGTVSTNFKFKEFL